MLSQEAMDSFAASFAARVNGEGCACILFPEVTDNEHAAFIVASCMEAIDSAFLDSDGDVEITRKAAHHAMTVALAFGLSYGRLDMLPDAEADGYSWGRKFGLTDEQLAELAGEDFLPES